MFENDQWNMRHPEEEDGDGCCGQRVENGGTEWQMTGDNGEETLITIAASYLTEEIQ